jgi:hypothetical protein
MKLIRDISYLPPEGEHAGTIIKTTLIEDTKNGKPRENLRFTIAVDPIPNDLLHDYRVRVDYWGNQAGRFIEGPLPHPWPGCGESDEFRR